MHFRKITALAVSLGFASLLLAKAPVPRPARELTITEPSGKATLLSTSKGNVVLIQFLYTTCQHCQAAARMYSKLQKELGPRGFQAFGVAFNEEVQATPAIVNSFMSTQGVTFPVGTASTDTVLSYLGIPVVTRFAVPQIVIVDRKGVVRAQSDHLGTSDLQDEAYLRTFLDGLLKEAK